MPRTSTTRIGTGAGHGGPAKGAGKGPEKGTSPAFTAESETRETTAHLENGDSVEQAYRMERRATKREQKIIDEQRAQELKDHLFTLAKSAQSERTQVSATEAWLNRAEGMPVARNINLSVNDMSSLSDADLDAEIDRLAGAERITGAGTAGETEAGLPE